MHFDSVATNEPVLYPEVRIPHLKTYNFLNSMFGGEEEVFIRHLPATTIVFDITTFKKINNIS